MADGFGKPGVRVRNLPETCLRMAVSGRPIFCQHREPGLAAPPSSLAGMDLTSSQQRSADTSPLILGVHLQMSHHKRLCAVVRQIAIDVPCDLEAALLDCSQCERGWMRSNQVCCNGVEIAGGIFASYPNCFAPAARHDFGIPCSANGELAMSEHLFTLLAERAEQHTQREQP